LSTKTHIILTKILHYKESLRQDFLPDHKIEQIIHLFPSTLK
jgi:hypothetical protein